MIPLSSAASAVIGLNVEPIGYAESVARLSSGAPVAVGAAQVLVVGLLETALADPRALGDVGVPVLLELLRADLEHAPEQLRGELLLRVPAQVALLDDHALEVL